MFIFGVNDGICHARFLLYCSGVQPITFLNSRLKVCGESKHKLCDISDNDRLVNFINAAARVSLRFLIYSPNRIPVSFLKTSCMYHLL